ncbi:MAG: NADP-dependent malic enzyme [Lachnospiraceae bacterium]|nr:NADP-dependent malic enzyme [Lachnospiraceae bacterium]
MTTNEKALMLHEQWNGKLETISKTPVKSREDLSLAYTPGVAEPCKVIAKDPEAAYKYTMKANTVAVVSDGSAVLGLGNIGPYAAMPVMEGKAVLFKEFGGVNAVPICLDTQDTEEIIKAVTYLAPGFGGINLEDISAPRCFEIEERLKEILDIPVFHDDQHGTAIVVLAGIINALKVVGKQKEDCRVVVNGAGSAGVAITKLLLTYGFPDIIMCDKVGIVSAKTEGLNWMQQKMAEITNLKGETGSLADALKGADIFVGVSAPGIVTPEMVSSMNPDAILFAMANPVPEIMPDQAKAAGARVVGTGRSDFPNQVNNVVAFPGIFKGALEGRASQITEEMKLAAAKAIASLVPDEQLNEDNIMPEAFDPKVAEVVSQAVKSHIKNNDETK